MNLKKYLLSIFFLSLVVFYGINGSSVRLKAKLGFVENKEISKSTSAPELQFIRSEKMVSVDKKAIICVKVDKCYYCRKPTKVI